jgi:hypothetical protein
MAEPFRNLIDGKWVEGASTTDNINPSNTNDIVGEYASASRGDAERAIAAAKAAFPEWSRSPIQKRHDILKAASDEILARKDELGRLLAREEGKTLPEGIGEVTRAGQIFSFFSGECLRIAGEMLDSVRPGIHFGDGDARAGGRRRRHHAVEFSDRDPGVENRAGAGLWQHGRFQAGRSGAGQRLGARRYPASRGGAGRRSQSRHGAWLGRGSGDSGKRRMSMP